MLYSDDLPAVSISRLRAVGVITAETTSFPLRIENVEKNVSIHLRKFPSGGSWSWFGCPTCGRWCRVLRLYGEDFICPVCCARRGIRPRSLTLTPRQRARRQIPKLLALLDKDDPPRLRPNLWGERVERRMWLELKLRLARVVASGMIKRDGSVREF